MRERSIVYLRLPDIRGADTNPKRHDGDGLAVSIGEFGLAELPLLDERTDRIVAGHGRIDDLRQRRAAGVKPPPDIRVDDTGEWLVPVQAGWASSDDAHARAYLAASNKLSENGGWDYDQLPDYLAGLAEQDLLALTGFSEDELAEMLADDPQADDDTDVRGDPDDTPGLRPDAISMPGDIWQLGRHRTRRRPGRPDRRRRRPGVRGHRPSHHRRNGPGRRQPCRA
jgi:ParB-like chromosome segregation protein Spo0J